VTSRTVRERACSAQSLYDALFNAVHACKLSRFSVGNRVSECPASCAAWRYLSFVCLRPPLPRCLQRPTVAPVVEGVWGEPRVASALPWSRPLWSVLGEVAGLAPRELARRLVLRVAEVFS
jgi:hypothetical protein